MARHAWGLGQIAEWLTIERQNALLEPAKNTYMFWVDSRGIHAEYHGLPESSHKVQRQIELMVGLYVPEVSPLVR